MTIQQARKIRKQIRRLRDQREARASYDLDAARLSDEACRLCSRLKDAGHPVYVQGELE